MAKTFEIVELVGISTESIEDAIKGAIEEAGKVSPVAWFNVLEQRGRVTSEGKIELQVTVKIGRKLNN
ncbi:MAG: dodecin family protein [Syntrophothermus sp.]